MPNFCINHCNVLTKTVVFLQCCSDAPVKEIIKAFDASEDASGKFIIADLPGGNLFIKTDKLEYVQKKVKEYSDKLHFEPQKEQQ